MKKHPNKEIQAALDYAIEHGWKVEKSKGGSSHPWGQLKCPTNSKDCRNGEYCQMSIWSTPAKPHNHARLLRKCVDKCISIGEENDE